MPRRKETKPCSCGKNGEVRIAVSFYSCLECANYPFASPEQAAKMRDWIRETVELLEGLRGSHGSAMTCSQYAATNKAINTVPVDGGGK